jgi:3-dehydroquinate synthase
MRQLSLDLAERSYNIYIDECLLSKNNTLESYSSGSNVLILTNETIAPLYLETLKNKLSAKKVFQFLLPDGEIHKNLNNYGHILDFLIEHKFRRNDTLIALGGGVIGDLGGFVAASFQRGMGFIQVPTSLLAQVDSSVGGKTAVNHSSGKNMIGAFYQPKAVFIDTQTLDTLPQREYLSGLAEVIKYALLGEQSIKSILVTQSKGLLMRNKKILAELIYYSCCKKAKIVAKDEKESGERAILNLGHTFGHALESLTNYKQYLHGEAVAIGICMAINLSLAKQLISVSVASEFKLLIKTLGLPLFAGGSLKADDFIEAMTVDKKNVNDKFRLILPTNNQCIIVEENDLGIIKQAINEQLVD